MAGVRTWRAGDAQQPTRRSQDEAPPPREDNFLRCPKCRNIMADQFAGIICIRIHGQEYTVRGIESAKCGKCKHVFSPALRPGSGGGGGR